MPNKYFPLTALVLFVLTGCQHLAPDRGDTTDSWNTMQLDQAQYVSEQNGFSCLAPSGVDFGKNGQALRKSLCFKTQDCATTRRMFYLDAHSMNILYTKESTEAAASCSPASALPK